MNIDTKRDLCHTCDKVKSFPYCCKMGDTIKFGDGVGFDNVIECEKYNKEKVK